jgi:predicted ATPase
MLASDLLREEADQYMLTEPLLSVTIPDTLQDSLMARLDQLDDAKEIAQLGAVVGREFPYAILQALSTMQEPQLQAGLARLVTSELLYQRGRPPQANYIFKHALIQDAAYASLLRNTRQQVHDQIAQLLETRFPETMTTHPELVAQHYTAAGRHEIAIDYWRQAGQLASARSAHAEAIKHFAQGLDLLQSLQDTPLRMQSELQLRVGMGVSLMATRGLAAEETGHAYNRAWELCQHVGATPELFPVLWGVFMFYFVRAEYQMAHELAEQLLDLGQRQHETAPRLVAHTALGFVLFWLGELSQAREHLEQGIALYRPEQHSSLTVRYGYEFGASCFSYLASVLWLLGYPSQAQQCNDNTLRLLRDLTHPFSRARTLQGVCLFHQLHRDTCATLAQADALIALADEEGFPIWRAGGLCFRGWALAVQGQSDAGIPQIIEGLTGWQSTGAELGAAYYLGLLAEAYGLAGQADEGLRVLRQALTRVAQTGECWREAELYRLWGELLEQREEGKCEVEWTPEACFLRALELARHQEAKSLELRAAMSLSRLWYQQDKWDAAHAQLTSVYNWFSEGLDTSDLLEAKALLDARPG